MKNATETKTRPIIFSGPMIQPIREGKKTQTRRVVKIPWDACMECDEAPTPHPKGDGGMGIFGSDPYLRIGYCERNEKLGGRIRCPYGRVGDRLWVRETWGLHDTEPSDGPENAQIYYRSTDGERHDLRYQKWRPSIFMPRWASRITLEITGVRVERLQEVSGFDARDEGYPKETYDADIMHFGGGKKTRKWFRDLWDSINAKRGFGWDKNPWVWVVEFRKCEPAR